MPIVITSSSPPMTFAPRDKGGQTKEERSRHRRKSGVSKDLVIGMKAAGLPTRKIQMATGLGAWQINHLAADPEAAEKIARYRDALKLNKIERAHRVEGKLWDRLEKEVSEGGAKDVDAVARALAASEKIQASVSGEGQKVEVTNSSPVVDLKVLIQQLLPGEKND